MTDNPIRDFARRLAKLEKAQRDKGSTPQLGTSSMHDNGTIYAYDVSGSVKATLGYQHDGTTTTTSQNGPTPPAPSKPTVEVLNGAIKVIWDGVFVDALVAPEDLARIDIRIVPDALTDPLTVPPSGVLLAQNWGQVPLPLEPGDYFVALISWTQSGAYHVSELSDPFLVTPVSVEQLIVQAADAGGRITIVPGPGDPINPIEIDFYSNNGSHSGSVGMIGDQVYLQASKVGLGADFGNDGDAYVQLQGTDLVIVCPQGSWSFSNISTDEVGVGYNSAETVSFMVGGHFIVEPMGDARITTAGEHDVLLETQAGTVMQARWDGEPVFPAHSTTAATENAVLTTGGALRRSTSSKRYKSDIQHLELPVDAILDAEPVTYLDKREVEAGETEPTRHVGFIAEQLHAVGLDQFVVYDEQGRPDAIAYSRLTAAVIPLLQSQQDRLAALEKAVAALASDTP